MQRELLGLGGQDCVQPCWTLQWTAVFADTVVTDLRRILRYHGALSSKLPDASHPSRTGSPEWMKQRAYPLATKVSRRSHPLLLQDIEFLAQSPTGDSSESGGGGPETAAAATWKDARMKTDA